MEAPHERPAQLDALSGVLTRAAFIERIEEELIPFEGSRFSICYLHIDNLRHFNRVQGIEAGDAVLRDIITWLEHLAVYRLVARYAGDGFTFIIPTHETDGLAERINALLPTYGESDGLQSKLGIIVCRRPMSPEECVERARFACDAIHEDEGVYQCSFDSKMEIVFEKRAYVVDHLDDAIAAGEIQAWSQPIVRLLTGRICEVEVLARWKSDRFGYLWPDEFVPELERQRIVHKLDLEVIRLACAQWSEARDLGINVPFGINLSRLDFELCDIYSRVRAIMQRYDVPTDQVHIEITESAASRSMSLVGNGVKRFREAGFQVYMDDFGTGYSSLTSLVRLPIDVVKFDKELLDRIEEDERARVVLADLVTTAKRLGIQTLCEGIENEDELLFLKAVGCEKAQGYYFSRPVPNDKIVEVLTARAHELELSAPIDNDYLNTIGQINLLDGTSAVIHGVEAAAFIGRIPIAIIEVADKSMRLLECNMAYHRLLSHMGFGTFEDFVRYTAQGDGRVNARAKQAMDKARKTGDDEFFDFIVNDTFCTVSVRLIARANGREAYLHQVSSVENAPQVSERVLLVGMIEGLHRKVFWKDRERRFLGANHDFLEYYGFSGLGDILGKTDEDLGWHLDDEPSRQDELYVLKGGQVVDMPRVCVCKGQPRRILTNKQPLISNGAIVGLVGYFEDVGPYEVDAEDEEGTGANRRQ